MKVLIGFVWLRTGTGEDGNEPAASIKGGEFLGRLSNYGLLRYESPSGYVT
jgi:hypothetical protein